MTHFTQNSSTLSRIVVPLAFLAATACAHGKLEGARIDLAPGSFARGDALVVGPIDASAMTFAGDKATDESVNDSERQALVGEIRRIITLELGKSGFRTLDAPETGTEAITLAGKVSHYDRGSGAARAWVGMGAGSATLFSTFTIRRGDKVLADFDVAATSGGRGGWTAAGSHMRAHMEDTAEIVAKYVSDRIN